MLSVSFWWFWIKIKIHSIWNNKVPICFFREVDSITLFERADISEIEIDLQLVRNVRFQILWTLKFNKNKKLNYSLSEQESFYWMRRAGETFWISNFFANNKGKWETLEISVKSAWQGDIVNCKRNGSLLSWRQNRS